MGRCYRNDTLVLVEDVKLVEKPERSIPSFVWLEPANEAFGLRADAFDLPHRFVLKIVSGATDGEACASSDLPLVSADEVTNNLIKGGAKVVDDVAYDTGISVAALP